MLRDFEDQTGLAASDLEGVEDGRKRFIKLDVNDGSDNGGDTSLSDRGGGLGRDLKKDGVSLIFCLSNLLVGLSSLGGYGGVDTLLVGDIGGALTD